VKRFVLQQTIIRPKSNNFYDLSTTNAKTWVGLKTGWRKTGRANFDTFLDITFVLLELFLISIDL
jgi:hypothetical protein